MRRIAISILCVILTASFLAAEERKPLKPSPKDKCPVCGMFVAKYPDFLAQVAFSDGTYAFFDGAKDMFKYLLNMKKYNPAKKPDEVVRVYVTDYYELAPIDGREAFYVTESDVYGPMGRELIPFQKEADARGFMKDHKGRALLKFKEVTAEALKGLD
jgi:copper chaperone NosL